MPDFIVKATGARLSKAARDSKVGNGANPKDFVEEGTTEAAIALGAPPPRKLRNDEEAIFVKTGARISAGGRLNRIATGVNKPADFAPIPGSSEAPAAPAPIVVTPAETPPAPPAPSGPTPTAYQLPSGLILSPAAAASYLARGLCAASDLVPVGSSPALPFVASPAPSAEESIVIDDAVLPINPDRFTRAQLGEIAEALGLDDSGSKAAVTARINGLGDETGTAAAIAALG